jgi:hypothetical protein
MSIRPDFPKATLTLCVFWDLWVSSFLDEYKEWQAVEPPRTERQTFRHHQYTGDSGHNRLALTTIQLSPADVFSCTDLLCTPA